MKNFISMFLMTSLLLGGMTFTIGKMSVCAAQKTGLKQHSKNKAHLFGSAKKQNLPPPTRILLRPWTISFTATFIPVVS